VPLAGALMLGIGHALGGLAGALAIFVPLVLAALGLWLCSWRAPVDHTNVNDDWHGTGIPRQPEPAAA